MPEKNQGIEGELNTCIVSLHSSVNEKPQGQWFALLPQIQLFLVCSTKKNPHEVMHQGYYSSHDQA